MLDGGGIVQRALRALAGIALFPTEALGPAWVIAVLILAFYPSVYLLARAAFLGIGRGTLAAVRLLGLTHRATFFRVRLPIARGSLLVSPLP